MTKREEAKQRVNEFLIEKFNAIQKDLIDLTDDSILMDMGIDSLDVVELEMEFERELDVRIDEAECVKTYGELISLYEDNMA